MTPAGFQLCGPEAVVRNIDKVACQEHCIKRLFQFEILDVRTDVCCGRGYMGHHLRRDVDGCGVVDLGQELVCNSTDSTTHLYDGCTILNLRAGEFYLTELRQG